MSDEADARSTVKPTLPGRRLAGIDLARCTAIIGMVAVHSSPPH